MDSVATWSDDDFDFKVCLLPLMTLNLPARAQFALPCNRRRTGRIGRAEAAA